MDCELILARCDRNALVSHSCHPGGVVAAADNPSALVNPLRQAAHFVGGRRARVPAIVLACLMSQMLYACSRPAAALPPARTFTIPPDDGVIHIREASKPFIETETVTGTRTDVAIDAPARVEFRDGAVSELGAPLDGRVVKVNAQIGDRVRENDPLVTLDCPDAAEMRASVESATASLREANSALDRQTRMMQQGVGTERDRLAAETKVAEVKAELSRVEADVAFVGMGSGASVVLRSPIAGMVISRKATVGMAVQKGSDPIVEIGNPSAVWIVADAFERDLPLVHEAARVRVQLSSLNKALDGRVTSIGSVVATGLRTAPVRISVDTGGISLRPGMYGRVQIEGAAKDLTVPTDAILIRDGKESVVYVQKDPLTYVRRTIVVGAHGDNGRVQIVSGISPGDKVVVRGALLLDGSADQLL